MKKTIISVLMAVFIAIAICSCSASKDSNSPTESDIETTAQQEQTDEKAQADYLPQTDPQEVSFPYTDDSGRIRYKMLVNGTELETTNYPFQLTEGEKGAYFPIKDILTYWGVEALESDDATLLMAKINGNVLKVNADEREMSFGASTVSAIDDSVKVIIVDGVLYVPSFFFMQFSDNTIVDFSSDDTSATLTTDLVLDPATSGIEGLSLEAGSGTGGSAGGSGYHICSNCGGAGGYNEAYYDQYLVNGQYVQRQKYRWVTCPVCSGRGQVK